MKVSHTLRLDIGRYRVIGYVATAINDQRSISEDRLKELERARIALFDSFKEVTNGEAKLLLLGLKDAQLSLRAYGDTVTELRKALSINNTVTSEESLQNWRSRLLETREVFFQDLSHAYQRLSN